MKKLCTLLAIAALWCGFNRASAQTPVYAAQTLGLYTNWCTASAAMLMTNIVIDCRKQNNVALQVSMYGDRAGTGAVKLYYLHSADGVTYETSLQSINLSALAGNTQVVTVTNLPSYGLGFIQLSYLTNADGSANISNVVMKYSIKISAP